MNSPLRSELNHCCCGDVVVDGERVEQSFILPESFIGFGGHFPGYPIVPAVIQVLMAQLVAEQGQLISHAPTAVERAKFHRQLRPAERIDICCVAKMVRGKAVIDATLHVGDELASSFWLTSV
ncbi:MAG: 3-hydroxyacyl-ACP dehydratase [Desulfuromonas sp.]|nr:MAG: 3-hydroxyacyl-ACP dehydratase [Desulfuromonas sp.]